MRDEDCVEADGALRRVLDQDSDCGSASGKVSPRGVEENTGEGRGEKEVPVGMGSHASTSGVEKEAEKQALRRGSTQSLEGGLRKHERRPSGRARSLSSAAVGEAVSSGLGGAAGNDDESPPPTPLLRRTSSVREKIEMFERTARASSGAAEAAWKREGGLGRTAQPQALRRSFSAKFRDHESIISAATTMKAPPASSCNSSLPCDLTRSHSFQIPARPSAPPAGMQTTDETMTERGTPPSNG